MSSQGASSLNGDQVTAGLNVQAVTVTVYSLSTPSHGMERKDEALHARIMCTTSRSIMHSCCLVMFVFQMKEFCHVTCPLCIHVAW